MSGYYDALPLPIRRQLTLIPPEDRHTQPYAYHVSKAPNIKRFFPWVPDTTMPGENRSVLRVPCALDVLYCFAGNGTITGNFFDRFYNGESPIRWTLYRITSEELYQPAEKLLPDVDKTKEVWVLPKDKTGYVPEIVGEIYVVRYHEDLNYYKDHRTSIEMAIKIFPGGSAWVDGREATPGTYLFTSRGQHTYGLPIGASRLYPISEARYAEVIAGEGSTQEISPVAILERLSYIPERVRKKIRIDSKEDLGEADLLYVSLKGKVGRLVPEYRRVNDTVDGISQFLPHVEVYRYLELALEAFNLPYDPNPSRLSADDNPILHLYSVDYAHVITVDNPGYKDRWFLLEEPPVYRYYFPVEHAQVMVTHHVQRTINGATTTDLVILVNVLREGKIATLSEATLTQGVYEIKYLNIQEGSLGKGGTVMQTTQTLWDEAMAKVSVQGLPVEW